MWYVTSGFVDDIMFAHNRANGTETKTMCTFYPVCEVVAPGRSLQFQLHLVVDVVELCVWLARNLHQLPVEVLTENCWRKTGLYGATIYPRFS